MSEFGDAAVVCFTATPITSVLGANALLPFNSATLAERFESPIVPVILFAATELMTVAPCVPDTSPARLPLKFTDVVALVALVAFVAFAALTALVALATT